MFKYLKSTSSKSVKNFLTSSAFILFCELLEISPREYQKYINGGFDYDIKKMAIMQCIWVQLRTEQAKKEAETNLTGSAKS